MFHPEDINRIRHTIETLTHTTLPSGIEVKKAPGLHVRMHGGACAIAAEDRNALARGFFLLGEALSRGETELDTCQRRRISSCGAMLDCSRNAVPTLKGAKKLIDHLAALGMNLLLLYTEDTYEVPEYPYLGYLRGRFTLDELRQLDAYAAGYDMELMPCIQTLGHMAQFLQWNESAPLRDKNDILLIDEEKTYTLIDAMLRALRSAVRTERIHIGMDEAHDVGLGRYLDKHGPVDRMELMRHHLEKVAELCGKHGFKPIMWSDMFFRLGSRRGDYYDREAKIPQEVIDAMPPVDMCYWDYYHMDEDFYDHMICEHAKMGKVVFAGGVWVWSGFLPQVKRTQATMRPALRCCARHQVDTVFATLWGDDGNETNAFLAMNQMPIFSEACWQGPEFSDASVERLGSFLTGIKPEIYKAFGEFYPDENDKRTGKMLVWCDPLYPLWNAGHESLQAAIDRFDAARAVVEKEDRLECRYAALLFDIAARKAELARGLRDSYLAGDRAYLLHAAEDLLPALHAKYQQLTPLHRTLWERDMRRNGWEVLCLRYGAVSARLMDAQDEIRRYLAGELDAMAELEEEPLPVARIGEQHYRNCVSPSVDL